MQQLSVSQCRIVSGGYHVPLLLGGIALSGIAGYAAFSFVSHYIADSCFQTHSNYDEGQLSITQSFGKGLASALACPIIGIEAGIYSGAIVAIAGTAISIGVSL